MHVSLKDVYFCPIEIISGLTDKGQFQYLTGIKGPKRGLTCIKQNIFLLRSISIFYQKIPKPFIGPLYQVIISS